MGVKGECRHGAACQYAHSEEDLEAEEHDLTKFKTKMCHFFEQGMCFKGTNCTFAHDPSEIQEQGTHSIESIEEIFGDLVGLGDPSTFEAEEEEAPIDPVEAIPETASIMATMNR